MRARSALAALVGTPTALGALAGYQGLRAVGREYLPEPDYAVEATIRGRGHPLRLAVLGDSTVAGIGSPGPERSLATLVAQRVADELGRAVEVTGYGASGARTADMPGQAARLAPGADGVLVVIGSNDATHALPPWRMRRDTAVMLRSVSHAARAPVVLGGIPEFATVPALPQPLRGVLGTYAAILRERQRAGAADADVPYVDIAAEASPRFLGRPETMSADAFHPSGVGYGLWADALAPAVAAAARATRR